MPRWSEKMPLDELHSQYHAGDYFTADDNHDRMNSPNYLIPCYPSLTSFALSPFGTAFGQSFAADGGAGDGRLIREQDVSALLPPPDPVAGMDVVAAAASGVAPVARKRKRFRTDRHSKIHTSQGLRDRRMRLSLDVARQFFSLQDMLGFDKASHTVNWLLHQSKAAIEQVMTGASKLVINHETLNASADVFFTDSSNSDGEHITPYLSLPPADASAASTSTKVPMGRPPSTEAAFDTEFSRRSGDKVVARAKEKTTRERKRESCQGMVSAVCEVDAVVSSKTTAGLEETLPSDGGIYERTTMALSPWLFHSNHGAMDDFLEEQLR